MPAETGTIRVPGGPELSTVRLGPAQDDSRGSVVFLHGYDDHSGRWMPFLDFLAERYSVLTFDFRGHGKSGGERGFCRRWSEYLDDLDAVLAADAAGPQRSPFLIGQSHGALVAGHRALERPSSLAGLVLCSSYLKLIMRVPRAKLAAARSLSRAFPAMRMKSDIKSEMLTADPERQEEDRADPLLARVATPRWFCTSLEAQEALIGSAREITTPVLMLHGTEDPIADMGAAREFYDALGSPDKTWREYEGARHEPLRDVGHARVWEDVRDWLDAHTR